MSKFFGITIAERHARSSFPPGNVLLRCAFGLVRGFERGGDGKKVKPSRTGSDGRECIRISSQTVSRLPEEITLRHIGYIRGVIGVIDKTGDN